MQNLKNFQFCLRQNLSWKAGLTITTKRSSTGYKHQGKLSSFQSALRPLPHAELPIIFNQLKIVVKTPLLETYYYQSYTEELDSLSTESSKFSMPLVSEKLQIFLSYVQKNIDNLSFSEISALFEIIYLIKTSKVKIKEFFVIQNVLLSQEFVKTFKKMVDNIEIQTSDDYLVALRLTIIAAYCSLSEVVKDTLLRKVEKAPYSIIPAKQLYEERLLKKLHLFAYRRFADQIFGLVYKDFFKTFPNDATKDDPEQIEKALYFFIVLLKVNFIPLFSHFTMVIQVLNRNIRAVKSPPVTSLLQCIVNLSHYKNNENAINENLTSLFDQLIDIGIASKSEPPLYFYYMDLLHKNRCRFKNQVVFEISQESFKYSKEVYYVKFILFYLMKFEADYFAKKNAELNKLLEKVYKTSMIEYPKEVESKVSAPAGKSVRLKLDFIKIEKTFEEIGLKFIKEYFFHIFILDYYFTNFRAWVKKSKDVFESDKETVLKYLELNPELKVCIEIDGHRHFDRLTDNPNFKQQFKESFKYPLKLLVISLTQKELVNSIDRVNNKFNLNQLIKSKVLEYIKNDPKV
jgi:hypothetical protein